MFHRETEAKICSEDDLIRVAVDWQNTGDKPPKVLGVLTTSNTSHDIFVPISKEELIVYNASAEKQIAHNASLKAQRAERASKEPRPMGILRRALATASVVFSAGIHP